MSMFPTTTHRPRTTILNPSDGTKQKIHTFSDSFNIFSFTTPGQLNVKNQQRQYCVTPVWRHRSELIQRSKRMASNGTGVTCFSPICTNKKFATVGWRTPGIHIVTSHVTCCLLKSGTEVYFFASDATN